MGAKVGGDSEGAFGDINVTPLVDVVLVLLIIFMVVTPMLSSGVDVKLPNAKTTTQAQDNGQHLVISIREDGVVFLDANAVSLDALIDEVNAEFRKDPSRAILIKADASLHYGEVRAVMDVLAEGGMGTQLLAAEKIKAE
jgi:biopolymer transport protein TolR